MSTVFLINHSDELVQALQAYKKLIQWPHEWKIPQKGDRPSLDQQDFFLVYNKEPEKLDGIRAVQHLRSHPETFGIPILFLSEKLSEYAHMIFDDLDFVTLCEMPFNSHRFFETASKIINYVTANKMFLQQTNEAFATVSSSDLPKAKRLLQQLSESFKGSLRFQIWSAQIHLASNELDQALKSAKSAQAIRPKSLEVNNLLSSIYFKMGDQVNYKTVVEQNTKIAEIHLQNLLHWGDVYLEQGNVQRSITAFEAALEKEPENQRAKQGILAAGLIEGRTNLAGSGALAANQSLEIARMFNLKGISMAEAGQFRTAERLYNNAMKILPDKEIAYKLWLNLGLCMKKNGDLEAALAYFEKCQELAPPEYKRAEAQIQFLKEEIRKESESRDFSQIKDRLTHTNETLNYKRFKSQNKGA